MSSGLANVNPQTWVSINLADKKQMQTFLQQLSSWATWVQSGGAAAGINALKGVLLENSIQYLFDDLGVMSSNPTISCANVLKAVISGNANNANRGITLTNLALGTEVWLYIRNLQAHTLTLTASDPSSNAYTAFAYYQSGSATGTRLNLTSAGFTGLSGFDVYLVGTTCTVSGSNFLPMHVLEG